MKRSTVLIPIALVIFLIPAASMRAQVGNFTVLAGSTVTNTGNTIVNGNLGVSPGTAITGFYPTPGGPGTVYGTIYSAGTEAATGEATALGVYNSWWNNTGSLTADLGGQTLTPGFYSYSSTAGLTGTLTLNFESENNQNIVLVIGSALTTASGSSVIIENAGTNDNVYWVVGSSATLGTGTAFEGNIIADQSITLTTGTTINRGSAIALNGAVTLDSNTITSVPEGGSALLYLLLAGGASFGAMFLISRNRLANLASA